jgi:hypothetical protein
MSTAPIRGGESLPNRSLAETFGFEGAELQFCTVGRFSDDWIAEVFLSNGKAGSAVDTAARGSATAASLALQHGAGIEVIGFVAMLAAMQAGGLGRRSMS